MSDAACPGPQPVGPGIFRLPMIARAAELVVTEKGDWRLRHCALAAPCPGMMADVDTTGAGTNAGAWPDDRRPAPARSAYQPVWWALVFAAVTTVGLGLLAWGLLVMHALTYGTATVIGPEAITAPDGARYRLGILVALAVNLATAAGLAGLVGHTPGRSWPPALQGLAAALVAAVAAGCALLVVVGINPVDFATPSPRAVAKAWGR